MEEAKVNRMKNAFWLCVGEAARSFKKEFKPDDEHLKVIAFLFNHTFFIGNDLDLKKSWWLWGAPAIGKTFIIDCLAAFSEKMNFSRKFKVIGAEYLTWEIKSGRVSAKECVSKPYLVIDHVDLDGVQREIGIWKMFLRERYEMHKRGARTCFVSNYPMSNQAVCFSKLFDPSLHWKIEDFLREVYMPKTPILI